MANDLFFDVVIIGGGLAGLSLAIQCARQQYKVALFEKEDYPFHKVCGEYISLESHNFLQDLGLDLSFLNLPVIKTLQLSDIKGKTYSFNLPLGGFGISRFSLDFSLYNLAVAEGVQVFTNTLVRDVRFFNDNFTIKTSAMDVQAKIVSGAWGKRSNLDKKWKRPFTTRTTNSLNNYIGIKYHIQYEHDKNSIALHNFNNGYCGLSKIEDGKSCLCYLTTAQNLKYCSNSIEQMERKILCKNPRLEEIFTSAKFLYEKPLAISQISFSHKSQVEDHMLMMGDAAGMISPLCGNGMSMAMHASKIASQSIDNFFSKDLSRESMEKEYEKNWRNTFSLRLWTGRNVQRLFGGDVTTSLFIKFMHLLPPLSRKLIRSTHGSSF